MNPLPDPTGGPMLDVIVLGAGPAGAEAALTAAAQGLTVMLFDEQQQAGGQVWRAPVGGFPGKSDLDAAAGDDLRARLGASSIQLALGHRVWSVVRQAASETDSSCFRVDAVGPRGNLSAQARFLVVATGAHERVVPFPGWTLPGVMGLAAATILLKSHGVRPGQRVVLAGCGPLLVAVAAGLVSAGVEVCALADLARRKEWLVRVPAVLARPRLAARGATWALKALRSGARVLSGHSVLRAEGRGSLERVVLGPVDSEGRMRSGPVHTFEADALIVGHGLTTACEVTRILRATHRFSRLYGGWIPEVDPEFQTSVPGLFAIGDGAGVRGQQLASLAGQRVGLALAARAGGPTAAALQGAMAAVDRQQARARPFSDAMSGLMAQRTGQVASIAADTVVCRCEDVTRAEIDAATDQCAGSIDQLKHLTRCGMGPCQGRYCGDTIQELMAIRLAQPREAIGQWTGRPPLRPVSLAEVMGQFTYDDIPIPKPAPL